MKISSFRLAATLTLLVLAGCMSSAGQGGSALGSAGPVRPTFATQLAGPQTYLAPMPTAVVILKPDDMARNRAFCAAFTQRLPTVEQANAVSVVAPNIVPTRWLVQLGDVPRDKAQDCEYLVGTYDYARAARLLSAAKLTEGGVSGLGPYLVLVVPDATGLHVVGLDGSAYAQSDFGRFLDRWSTALTETQATLTRQTDEPGVVRSAFNLIAAIFRTAAGIAGGMIQGVIAGL
jgi:hypothetical protein